MCFYQFFSEFDCQQDRETLAYKIKRRRKPLLIVPTPQIKPVMSCERWCYQALMLYTPFRHHKDVMRHPAYRNCTQRVPPMLYIDPDLSTDMPETQPLVGPPPVPPVFTGDIWNMTPAEAQQYEGLMNAPPPEYCVYDKATELLKDVVGRTALGWWPEKYANCPTILTAIQDHLAEGYVESQTEPDPAELLNALSQYGFDPDGPLSFDEMHQAISEHVAASGERRFRNNPSSGFYVGPGLKAAVKEYVSKKKTCFSTASDFVDRHPELRTLTTRELLRRAEDERSAIKEGVGAYRTYALRQRVFLLAVIEAVIDVIKVDHNIPCRHPRTCRLILHGEAGTGKSFVLKTAAELCCKYLEPKAVKVFAPTAFAAKVYEECPCGSTTMASVWKKNYSPGDNQPHVKTKPMKPDAALALKLEINTVRAMICDEMSMLSPNDLAMINERLRQISEPSRKVCIAVIH